MYDAGKVPGTVVDTVMVLEAALAILSRVRPGAEQLTKLRPRVFRYNGLGGTVADGTLHVGVVAQVLLLLPSRAFTPPPSHARAVLSPLT